jgi:hypothetical protein
MRLIERGIERYSELSPKRQKAIEYFCFSGLGAALAGVSVVPLVEGVSVAVGAVGVVEGTVVSIITYRWGWQALDEARQEESTSS